MKLKYSILFVFMSVGCFAFAQDTTFSEKYFKLINTYNSIDEVYRAHPELKPKPTHIVINDDEVVFYDDNGTVINRMPVKHKEDIPKTDTLYEKYHDKYKISRRYINVEGELLVIAKSYGNEPSPYPFRSLTEVYDKTGKLIVNNLLEDTYVKLSPNGKYFATSYEGEVGMGLVHIFDITGKEICTYKNMNESSIRYDINNNLIINSMNDFYVVVKDSLCNDLVKYDYFKNLNINYISFVFYSGVLDQFLISTLNYKIFYIDNNSSKLLWERYFDSVEACIFNKDKNNLIIISRTTNKKNLPKFLKVYVISINSGNIISKIHIGKLISINDNLIIFEKGGKYYEYEI